MTTKEQLYRLIDRLPESEHEAAERFLEYLNDTAWERVVRTLDEAPQDDEVPTPEEEKAAHEGREAYRRGDYRPWEEVREELARE